MDRLDIEINAVKYTQSYIALCICDLICAVIDAKHPEALSR